ncbi:hypothetical protein [Merismopedia glauca]|uniref:Uncharacterized protein n=1 Tax=Merismopedia glauca CCAP 1448/3 TaxID=1296344 RepID=A0A2T1BZW9_9CYAN|nr:hypothetical protein [Merismopedia glauca]PSB01551.1 hypothetical protein C7B64_17790 [Merismopedia glauca CCAP 1448/3]
MAYVGTTFLTEDRLKLLLVDWQTKETYYFLRWCDRVSGFISQLPENFPSPAGQMFNREFELRWKKQGDKFSVLILSKIRKDLGEKWHEIPAKWTYQDRNASMYPVTETRFPKAIQSEIVNVGQRYFQDSDTKTIHFIALTVV